MPIRPGIAPRYAAIKKAPVKTRLIKNAKKAEY